MELKQNFMETLLHIWKTTNHCNESTQSKWNDFQIGDYYIIYDNGILWRLQWKFMDIVTRIFKNTVQSGVLHRITNMDTWKTHVISPQTTTTWYGRTNMVTTDRWNFYDILDTETVIRNYQFGIL